MFSLDTELRPLRGGGKDGLPVSIFFVPGVGIELLRVFDQGCLVMLNVATGIGGVGMTATGEVVVAVGDVDPHCWPLGSAESKLRHTFGLVT